MGNGVMCRDEDGGVVGCDRFGIPGFGTTLRGLTPCSGLAAAGVAAR